MSHVILLGKHSNSVGGNSEVRIKTFFVFVVFVSKLNKNMFIFRSQIMYGFKYSRFIYLSFFFHSLVSFKRFYYCFIYSLSGRLKTTVNNMIIIIFSMLKSKLKQITNIYSKCIINYNNNIGLYNNLLFYILMLIFLACERSRDLWHGVLNNILWAVDTV